VTDDEIIFHNLSDGDGRSVAKVSRESGIYSDIEEIPGAHVRQSGRCKKAPFTDLPEKQF
jgi:hypothetical protein